MSSAEESDGCKPARCLADQMRALPSRSEELAACAIVSPTSGELRPTHASPNASSSAAGFSLPSGERSSRTGVGRSHGILPISGIALAMHERSTRSPARSRSSSNAWPL